MKPKNRYRLESTLVCPYQEQLNQRFWQREAGRTSALSKQG
jgi:hypothetical protein